jgi:hypothetical protein
MRYRPYVIALVAGVGLAMCAGLVLAQAPDQGGAPAAPPVRERRGPGAAPILAMLLAGENISSEVANTDKGVDLTITTDRPEAVAALQERIQGVVMAIQQTEGARRGPWADVEVSSRKVEKGAVVSFTSDRPEVVQRLQQGMPQQVANARAQAQQGMARWQATREALTVLAREDVKVEVTETDSGVTITITSADPETVKQIKEKLSPYYKGQQEQARAMLQRGGPGMGGFRGPGAAGGAPGPRGGARGGARRGQGAAQ